MTMIYVRVWYEWVARDGVAPALGLTQLLAFAGEQVV